MTNYRRMTAEWEEAFIKSRETLHDAPSKFAGYSYRQASIEGANLTKQAHETGNWHAVLDDLVALRSIMDKTRT